MTCHAEVFSTTALFPHRQQGKVLVLDVDVLPLPLPAILANASSHLVDSDPTKRPLPFSHLEHCVKQYKSAL